MLETLGLGGSLVPVSDLGYYGWIPQGPYRSVDSASAEEILEQIDFGPCVPASLVDLEELNGRLPWDFPILEPVLRWNRYPYGQDYVAALCVAKKRKVELDSIQFLFGSFTLFFLTMEKPEIQYQRGEKCLIARVPGTSIVLVTRYKIYEDNSSCFGPQFERLVTGTDQSREDVQHLQIMKIGQSQILFAGQVDAINAMGDPTEVKYFIQPRRELRIIFQSVGSGSIQICKAECRFSPKDDGKPPVLKQVKVEPTECMFSENRSLYWEGRRIVKKVAWLQQQSASLKEGDVKELHFLPKRGKHAPAMELRDSNVTMDAIFPNIHSMLELLK